MSQLADELHDLDDSVFGSHLLLPCRLRAKAAEECFGIQVIALFH